MNHVVYRFYSATPELIYVGTTGNFGIRMDAHKSKGAAWFMDVRTVTVEHFLTADAAKAAERSAIAEERPTNNVKHAPAEVKKAQRERRRRVDTIDWPTHLLTLNPDAFDDRLAVKGITITDVRISQDFLEALYAGEATAELWQAQMLARELGTTVAALFPNRNPIFSVANGHFVATRSLT